MEEEQQHPEPEAAAFEDAYSDEDEAAIETLKSRHRARVLVPLAIVILVAVVLGWIGPVGPDANQPGPASSERTQP